MPKRVISLPTRAEERSRPRPGDTRLKGDCRHSCGEGRGCEGPGPLCLRAARIGSGLGGRPCTQSVGTSVCPGGWRRGDLVARSGRYGSAPEYSAAVPSRLRQIWVPSAICGICYDVCRAAAERDRRQPSQGRWPLRLAGRWCKATRTGCRRSWAVATPEATSGARRRAEL